GGEGHQGRSRPRHPPPRRQACRDAAQVRLRGEAHRGVAMSDHWVIWSEEHGCWWMPGSMGYTRSLREAGRSSEKQAKLIEGHANKYLPDDRPNNEVAMPDPWPMTEHEEQQRHLR